MGFLFAFYSSRPFNQLVPSLLGIRGGLPLWEAELPFTMFTASGRACGAAQVTLRKEVSAFLEGYDNPVIRFSKGNYQSPALIPRSIAL